MGKHLRDNAAEVQSLKKVKKHKKAVRRIPLPEEYDDSGGDDDGQRHAQLSDEDVAFVQQHSQRLSFLQSLPRKEMDRAVSQARAPAEKKAAAAEAQRARMGKRTRPAANDNDEGSLDGTKGGDAGADSDSDSESGSEGEGEGTKARHATGKGAARGKADEEGEAWERRPRHAASSALAGPDRAAPLPIKSLAGAVVFSLPHDVHDMHAAPLAQLSTIAGIAVEDDLEAAQQQAKQARLEEERARQEAAAAFAKQQQGEREQQLWATDDDAARFDAGASALSTLLGLEAYQSLEQRREEAKKAMAASAQALLADPEAQAGKQLRVLLVLLKDADTQVSRLAMLSLLAVFRDVLPAYRIRPAPEAQQEVASREVKRVWEYEAVLLKGYQQYLKALLEALNAARAGRSPAAHGRVAARCMSGLLTAAPHFNYASDLLQAVVPNMASKDEQIRRHCCDAVAALVQGGMGGGDSGATAVEAVQLVADLVKRRKCVAPVEVVSCLLGLTFPEIASGEDFEAAKRSKKAKKKTKGGKAKDEVSRAFLEAQAVADRDTRRVQQSSALEALFEVFFRVLKAATASGLIGGAAEDAPPMPASRFLKRFPLLAPTLEGLSRFSHLISVDYFADLMAVLEQVLASSALPSAVRLRCLLSATTILKGQGEALTIDRRGFHVHLYSSLARVILSPLNEEEGQNEDEDSAGGSKADGSGSRRKTEQQRVSGQSAVVGSAAAGASALTEQGHVPVLLIQLLEAMILDSKLLDAARQAAFAKRIAAAAASAGDSGAALGLLCVLQRMVRRQPKLRGMLDNEAGGPSGHRMYRPEVQDPAEAAALSVPLWDLTLLTHHYHPHVAQAAGDIAVMNVTAAAAAAAGGGSGAGAGGGAVLPLGTSPAELAARYSSSTGGFRPPPTAPPKQRSAGSGGSKSGKAARATQEAQRQLLADDSAAAFAAAACAAAEEPAATHAAAAAEYSELAAGAEAGGGEEEESTEAALVRHFKTNRLYQRNTDLRREHALLAAQLRLFHEHLQQQQRRRRRKTAKVGAAAANGPPEMAKAAGGKRQRQLEKLEVGKQNGAAGQPVKVKKKARKHSDRS